MEKFTLYTGLDSLYIAPILQDDLFAYKTGTPEPLAPVGEREIQEQQNIQVVYHDMGIQDARSLSFETLISIVTPVLPARIYGLITGDINCETTGMIYDTGIGRVPLFALGYREELSGGQYRYVWHQKGYFTKPDTTISTRSTGAEAADIRLGFVSVPTVHVFNATGMPQKSIKADTCDCSVRWNVFFKQVVTPDNMAESVCLPPGIDAGIDLFLSDSGVIKMVAKDQGDTIIYTTDGSEPLEGVSKIYSEPVHVEELIE